MSLLFNRKLEVRIGDASNIEDSPLVVIKGDSSLDTLDIAFSGEKACEPKANVMTISIWNLSEDTRNKLQGASIVELWASYADSDLSRIFAGDMMFCGSELERQDRITSLVIADGGRALKYAHTNASFARGTERLQVFNSICNTLNAYQLYMPNVPESIARPIALWDMNEYHFTAASQYMLDESESRYGSVRTKPKFIGCNPFIDRPLAITKKTHKALSELLDPHLLMWFILDFTLYVLPRWEIGIGEDGSPVPVISSWYTNGIEPIKISSDSGLIGVPEKLENGGMKFTHLLDGRLIPGAGVSIFRKQGGSSISLGDFRIARVSLRGGTSSAEWYCEVETFEV